MLEVEQYEYIRTAHRIYNKNISEIARETGHSRNTVKKVLRGEYGGYSKRKTQPCPVLGPHHDIICKWLEEDLGRPQKQRHTAKRIYDRLVKEHEFTGSETTVRHYVSSVKRSLGLKSSEAFIPMDPASQRRGGGGLGQRHGSIGRRRSQGKNVLHEIQVLGHALRPPLPLRASAGLLRRPVQGI